MRLSRRKGQRGAAAVEFALILPVLLLLVLGTIDWGYYFYVREVVTDAVRAGARAGSLDTANPQATALNTATAFLQGLNLNGATAENVSGCPGGSVCVQIEYPTGSITGFLTSVMPAKASAKAIMRQEP